MPKQSKKPAASGPMPYNLRRIPGRAKRGTRKEITDKGEWDDVNCPICLDPPHKAILLICSSHRKGCRPYVCDTTYSLSNCFDQLCDSQSVMRPAKRADDGSRPTKFRFPAKKRRLSCPLCRGRVTGFVVDERARDAMNLIVRTCVQDSCDIRGHYEDLKDHAKVLHEHEDDCFLDEDDLDDWMYGDEDSEDEDVYI